MPDRPEINFDFEEIRRNLQEAVQHLNEQAQRGRQDLNFSLDKSVNRFVITVKNSNSGEVIRQIPDEVILKIGRSLEDIKGLLHNQVI